MPELPEVEIVRRGLEPVLTGQRIAAVEQRRADLRFPFPENFAARLTGRLITAITRRAKYLLIALDGGDTLVIHLGMSGRLSVAHPNKTAASLTFGDYAYDTGCLPAHDHAVLTLSSAAVLTYNDPRRFGFMLLIPSSELASHPLFVHLGVEPLGNTFDAAYLAHIAQGKRTALKAFLLDQRIIAGLGNIYVSEALHRAAISPRRSAHTLAKNDGSPAGRALRLVPEIRKVLLSAIAAGGSSLKDYRHTDGTKGAFQTAFTVYGREGGRCFRPGCSGIIRRTLQNQRATFFCPKCQR